jgi:hypothetical protein
VKEIEAATNRKGEYEPVQQTSERAAARDNNVRSPLVGGCCASERGNNEIYRRIQARWVGHRGWGPGAVIGGIAAGIAGAAIADGAYGYYAPYGPYAFEEPGYIHGYGPYWGGPYWRYRHWQHW